MSDEEKKDLTETEPKEEKPSGSAPEKPDRPSEYEETCSMCHRPESKCGKLMKLPGGLNICPV